MAAFYKVNVDKAKDVARAHKISAMPTFKVYESNSKKELESIRGKILCGGWQVAMLIRKLSRNGCYRLE